jgi:serine/threonine protein kinase
MKKSERVGPYYLLSPLGEGRPGRVWLATAGAGGEKVAIKLVREGDTGARERLMHECEMAMLFDHPNIVRMYECGEANGTTWITTRYIAGPHGGLTLANFRQLLLAMVHVHANGVTHADIRNANLLLDEYGDLHLGGFAMARRHGQAGVAPAGAPPSVTPEQLRGQAVDTRTDIFAAGVVLYEILTGKAPFAGTAFDIMQQILQDAQPAPSVMAPGLGSSFDDVVRRALARDKDDRFGSVFEFLSAFDAACRRGVRLSA